MAKSMTQIALSAIRREARYCRDVTRLFRTSARLEELAREIQKMGHALATKGFTKFLKKMARTR